MKTERKIKKKGIILRIEILDITNQYDDHIDVKYYRWYYSDSDMNWNINNNEASKEIK